MSVATSAAAGIGRIWATPVPAHNDRYSALPFAAAAARIGRVNEFWIG